MRPSGPAFLVACLAACAPAAERNAETPPAAASVPDPGAASRIEEGIGEFRRGNFPRAGELFAAAAAERPDDPVVHFYLGSALLQQDRNGSALEALDRALALRDPFPEARLARARVRIRVGDYSGAERDLERIRARDPDNLIALFNLGFVHYRNGDFAAAIERLERVRELRPDHPDAPYYQGLAEMRLGRDEAAVASLGRATELDPENAGAWQNLGMLLVRLGRREAGEAKLAEFQRVSDAETAREHLREQINSIGLDAYFLARDGRTEEAIGKYREILAIDPRHLVTHKDLAVLLLAGGRVEEGLALLERATEIDPNYAAPWMYLSRIYEELGDGARAAAAAERYRMLESGREARRDAGRRW